MTPFFHAPLFSREKYWEYEYEEVITPNIYNFDLWVSELCIVLRARTVLGTRRSSPLTSTTLTSG
jgi:hypothetical protein